MSPLFQITIRSGDDEVVEFESENPVVHLDMPAGRFHITVRCLQPQSEAALPPKPQGALH
jgi:hypothetical protein